MNKNIKLSLIALTIISTNATAEESLEDITVTATNKLSQDIKKSTAQVSVITAEEIEERGYRSVPEVLSHSSGFAFASNGGMGQASSMYFRGFGASDILVMIDGIPMTDYTQPSPASALEHISLDNVAQIEIVKGAQSGIWGSNAVAGVINIVTKANKRSDYGNIKLKAGSHSTHDISIDVSKSTDKIGVYMGGTILDTDGISALTPRDAEADKYKRKEFHLRATLKPSSTSTISYFLHRNKSDFDYDSGTANDTLSNGQSKDSIYGFDYRFKGEKLSVEAKASSNTIKRLYNSSFGPFNTEGRRTNLSLTGDYQLTANKELLVGAEHTTNSGKSTFSPKNSFKNSALFASYSQTIDSFLGAKTTLNAVVRYDSFDKFDNKTTYRVGFRRECEAIDGLHSAVNVYTAYKAPSITQYSNAIGTLKPESTDGYDISIGYKKLINITYFKNKKKDKITASYDPVTYVAKYSNTGDGATKDGVEISGEYSFGDSGFILGANATYMIDNKDDAGKKIQRVPKKSANLFLDYYFGEESHIGVSARYVGERRDVYYAPITYTPTDVTLGSYTTVDMTYNTKIGDNLSLSITAKNILDKQYETVKGYSTEGRSVYASVSYKF